MSLVVGGQAAAAPKLPLVTAVQLANTYLARDHAFETVIVSDSVPPYLGFADTISAATGWRKADGTQICVDPAVPQSLTLSTYAFTLSLGASQTITPTVTPAGASQAVTWSFNPAVYERTGNSFKRIGGVDGANAEIGASTVNGLSKTAVGTLVTASATASAIYLSSVKDFMKPGATKQLTVTQEPANAGETITFTTSNAATGTVNSAGQAVNLSESAATLITATASPSGKTDTFLMQGQPAINAASAGQGGEAFAASSSALFTTASGNWSAPSNTSGYGAQAVTGQKIPAGMDGMIEMSYSALTSRNGMIGLSTSAALGAYNSAAHELLMYVSGTSSRVAYIKRGGSVVTTTYDAVIDPACRFRVVRRGTVINIEVVEPGTNSRPKVIYSSTDAAQGDLYAVMYGAASAVIAQPIIATIPPVASNLRIVFDGNSIFDNAGPDADAVARGYSPFSLGTQAYIMSTRSSLNGCIFQSSAVKGQTIDQMQARRPAQIDATFVSGRRNILLVNEIRNQLFVVNSNVDAALAKLKAYCQAATAAGYEVYIVAPLQSNIDQVTSGNMTTTGMNATQFLAALDDAYNKLKANWASYGAAGFIDLRQSPNLHPVNPTYYWDGTHPITKGGYTEMERIEFEYVYRLPIAA